MSILALDAAAYRTAEEVFDVLRGFRDRTLPRERWTHAAHLTVALWHLLQYDWPEAVRRVREGIKAYNAAHGVASTPEGGYHETITVFWLRFVRSFLEDGRNEGRSLVALANDLAASADRGLPLRHYSRARLFSPEARAGWVEPDLLPLD
jgi:hypothetical protein